MRLATLRTDTGTVAVRLDPEAGIAVEIDGFADVGALLGAAGWQGLAAAAAGTPHDLATIEDTSWAPVIPAPGKIVCVGLNYRNHILEMGRRLPEYPTLFAKYPEALIGPYDAIVLPAAAPDAVDWEGELAVIVGAKARRVSPEQASASIAGYSVLNDVTMRDYQYRTTEWFQGKTFEASSPFGPVLVTADEFTNGGELVTLVNDIEVQHAKTSDLVFGPEELVSYISQIVTLNPGDVISSGTPGGVGHARKPPRYLDPGAMLTTRIDGIGELRNPIKKEV
jgi:acylpyruvate hydrolase